MKKFRFLFVVAVVVVFALSLSLIAGATGTPTAETYEQIYVGEYDSIDVDASGNPYTGEAHVIFGKVTGSEQAGIILEKYATTDSACATVLETKYFGAREGRIAENGEFAIALYNVADGYYQAKVVAGDYNAPSAEGEYVKFSKGVATYTATFKLYDGNDTTYTYTVAAGGEINAPEVERPGYELVGWVVNPYAAHNTAGWGTVKENTPNYFKNFDADRTYTARWAYVGENGDAKAPETFKLTMSGYSKFSVHYDGYNETVTIPAGSVGIMEFDVLEDATGTVMSIGLANTSSEFWWLAANGDTDGHVFAPTYHSGKFYEYQELPTKSNGNLMIPQNVLKEGNSVKLVYKPYEAEDNLGWYRAYVKTADSDEYVLYAGWEGMIADHAYNTSMPALITGNGYVGAGSMIVPLANCHVGIDTDGDYTTTDDFTDMGVGVAEMSYDQKDNRHVIIDPSYVHSSQYKYTFVDGNKTSNTNTMFIAAGTVNRNDYAVDDGEYLEMKFTVLDSNIDEIEQTLVLGRISLGFGISSSADGANNGYSGIHGYGMEIGLEDGEEATVFAEAGPANNTWYDKCDTIEATGNGVGMRTLLQPGTEIMVVIAFDLTDDGANTGYTQIYYKTTDMDDYDIAAEMNGVGNQVAHSAHTGLVNSYPLVWLRSNYVDNEATKLTTTIGSFSVATYDADGNVTSKIGLISPSAGFNGGQTVISYPAAK